MHGNATKSRRIVRSHSAALVCLSALAVAVLAACLATCSAAAPSDLPLRPWSSQWLKSAAPWDQPADKPFARPIARGLRVEVPAERKYSIAAMSNLRLPPIVRQVRVRVEEVSPGGRWFARLYGELRGGGRRQTLGLFERQESTGLHAVGVDPRVLALREDLPVQLQLGIEGPVGAYAVFGDVEFLAEDPSPRANVPLRVRRQEGQRDIAVVQWMPTLPEPLRVIDWRSKAAAFDRLAFDLQARGEHLPLLWIDPQSPNTGRPAFGLPSYVGSPQQRFGKVDSQESITCMGAVLGASLAGVDKRRGPHDYVAMCEAWFNVRNGLQLVLNRQNQGTGGSYWYELMPHVLFYGLVDRHPDEKRLAEIMRTTADRWEEAVRRLRRGGGLPDFHHTAFDFAAMRPVDNGQWREPDAAAAVAWLQYMAWVKFGDRKYLDAAEASLQALEASPVNPYYEVLLPFGATLAARINAERGGRHNVDRLLNWCFDVSDTRGGWGVIVGRWGRFDCDGLLGSIDNQGGYAFAMNTFVQGGALAPLPRYDARYARALGKWLLCASNSARLYYPDALPADHQSSASWRGDPGAAIAYEGLRRSWRGKSPYATGDPLVMNWGPATDLGVYGSSFVGWFGAIFRPTNVPAIQAVDCLATDFFHGPAYPTFLYFNPHDGQRSVQIEVGPGPRDLYDAASHRMLARNVAGRAEFSIPGDSAVVLVVCPGGAEQRQSEGRLSVGGVVVDYRAAQP